ncbi:MAG: GDSL-type esterase/lipase family protein [Propionibacteriaceae bacterium]|nr:GDSL-type esterase/lipase family protein [Propionibacteriaceae bacterium]
MAKEPPTLIFAGDSVTDCGRREDPTGLGSGYPALLAASPALAGWRVLNRGVSGDRVGDQRHRWAEDVASPSPDVVSLLIGINNTWRRFDSDDPTTPADFERDYRACVENVGEARLIMVEPFLLPLSLDQALWREDLDPKIEVVRHLAREYDATLVEADVALNLYPRPSELTDDGVHPSVSGHQILAMMWLSAAHAVLAEVREG